MSKRIAEIEGIRGISCLIIIAGHICILNEHLMFWYWGSLELFFGVSAFVITRLLLENLGQTGFLKNYFIRRLLRIWPMYFIGMAFAFLVTWATDGVPLIQYGFPPDWQPSLAGLLLPFAFLQNTEMYFGFPREQYLYAFQHSWSVSVEEHFYTLWPLLLLGVRRIPPLPRLLLACAAIALSALLRHKGLHYWLLLTRLDGFVLGGLLAFLEVSMSSGRLPKLLLERIFRWLWVLPCLLLTPYVTYGYFGIDWHLPRLLDKTLFDEVFNFALLGCAMIGYCVFVPRPVPEKLSVHRLLRWAPLQRVGTISYSTYLLHVPVIFVISPYLISVYGLPPIFSWIIGFGLTFAMANLTYPLIEARAMRLKKPFQKADAQSEVPLAASTGSPAPPAKAASVSAVSS